MWHKFLILFRLLNGCLHFIEFYKLFIQIALLLNKNISFKMVHVMHLQSDWIALVWLFKFHQFIWAHLSIILKNSSNYNNKL